MENKKDFDLITLGEIMLRLSPPNNGRIQRSDLFEKHAGGAELNVASGVSLLGMRTALISKLPASDLGTYIKNRIRFCSVSDDFIVWDTSPAARLGIYYYENGAYPRKPSVVYDRKNSSFNSITMDEIPESVFSSTRMFHTSGITLAVSKQTREIALELIKKFKEAGASISFDVNYRATLWSEAEARSTITHILPYVDIFFVSEESSRRMFGKTGNLHEIHRSFCKEFPNIKIIASTERRVVSPKNHSFTSTIYSAERDMFYTEPAYKDIDVVDRIGSGDAYCAGVLFGMLKYNDPEKALQYGNATCATKNTIPGDLPIFDYAEITRIIENHHASGPVSEMNR